MTKQLLKRGSTYGIHAGCNTEYRCILAEKKSPGYNYVKALTDIHYSVYKWTVNNEATTG